MSGPLLDRIDLALDVPPVDADTLSMQPLRGRGSAANGGDGAVTESEASAVQRTDTSAAVRTRVALARDRQRGRQGKPNARLLPAEIARHCVPDANSEALLAQAMRRMGLSARAYHRVLKVARTIVDLAGAATIASVHVAEAVSYRRFDALPP